VAVSPDGKMIASGASDQTVRLWETATGRELFPPLTGHGDKVTALAFSPDGKTLVSAGGTEDRTLKVWNTATGKEVRTIRDPGPTNDIPMLLVSPDGKHILAWVANSLVEVYDLATGAQVSSRTTHERKITSLAFSSDGDLAALGGEDGSVRVLSLSKLERLPGGEFPAHQEALADLVFTPDKKLLITADRKGQLCFWDLAKRAAAKPGQAEPERTVEAHKGGLVAFAMGPGGKFFATAGGENVVKVWETSTGKEVRAWDFSRLASTARPFIHSLAFTPDGKSLVTANGNSTLYLLEAP
jgi:WD40 repeat protein